VESIFVGMLACFAGYCILLGYIFYQHFHTPKQKRERLKQVINEYFSYMQKLGIEESDIYESLGKFENIKDIQQKTKQLKKAIKKYKW